MIEQHCMSCEIEQHCVFCEEPRNPRLCRLSCKMDWAKRTEKERQEKKPLHYKALTPNFKEN
jgi:hypothetical protein